MKPLGKVNLEWSSNLAYAIGLITTDGSLSKNKRHISLASKDKEMIENFKKALRIHNVIGVGKSGGPHYSEYYKVQFGDVMFYKFLESIGLSANKTKTIGAVMVPDDYFADFLRGHFDGDGCFYAYRDKRWKSSFMYYTTFVSASETHIAWLRSVIEKNIRTKGHIVKAKNSSVYQLRYAKKESNKIARFMYYSGNVPCLSRKRLKIEKVLGTIEKL